MSTGNVGPYLRFEPDQAGAAGSTGRGGAGFMRAELCSVPGLNSRSHVAQVNLLTCICICRAAEGCQTHRISFWEYPFRVLFLKSALYASCLCSGAQDVRSDTAEKKPLRDVETALGGLCAHEDLGRV